MVVEVVRIYFSEYIFKIEPISVHLLLYWIKGVREKKNNNDSLIFGLRE